MKKTITLVFVLALYQNCFCQSNDSESGIIAGVQRFTVGDVPFTSSSPSGWFVGIYSDIYSNEHWSGQGEFNFTQQDGWWGLQLASFQKYYINERFPLNLQIGLQLDHYTSKKYKFINDDWKFYYGYGLGADLGDWLLQVRYIDELFGSTDFKFLSIGIGYKI